MKKFYKTASAVLQGQEYGVLLDGAVVKTPARHPLLVPGKKLADAIVGEWAAQGDKIDPASMPLTKLANVAIDGVVDAEEVMREAIFTYAQGDLLFYRAEYPEALIERQNKAFTPVLNWLKEQGMTFNVTTGILHVVQPEKALNGFRQKLEFLDAYQLTALQSMTSLMGSALLAYAVFKGFLEAEAAWAAAHIEEDWTTEHWGQDEEAAQRRAARWLEMDGAARMLALLADPT